MAVQRAPRVMARGGGGQHDGGRPVQGEPARTAANGLQDVALDLLARTRRFTEAR